MRAPATYDLAIIGGGIVGLAFACAAAQQDLSVVVIEAQTPPPSTRSTAPHTSAYSNRVSALNGASYTFLQQSGVWPLLDLERIAAYTRMMVCESRHGGQITFNHDDIDVAALGYIVENGALHAALSRKIQDYPQVTLLTGTQLSELAIADERAILTIHDAAQPQPERTLHAALVIGADGANSIVRARLGIAVQKQDYAEQAIVATVHTTLPLAPTAYQVFLETGPLAFLPLPANPSHALASIVWTLPQAQATSLMALDDAAFTRALNAAHTHQWGPVTHTGPRAVFPLYRQAAAQYIANRTALIGDAAHMVHPLAGQGLNMGLADAYALNAQLATAIAAGKDFASRRTLRTFERRCKAQHALMALGIDKIHTLFNLDGKLWAHSRSIGLNMTDHLAPIKQWMMRYAMGERLV